MILTTDIQIIKTFHDDLFFRLGGYLDSITFCQSLNFDMADICLIFSITKTLRLLVQPTPHAFDSALIFQPEGDVVNFPLIESRCLQQCCGINPLR